MTEAVEPTPGMSDPGHQADDSGGELAAEAKVPTVTGPEADAPTPWLPPPRAAAEAPAAEAHAPAGHTAAGQVATAQREQVWDKPVRRERPPRVPAKLLPSWLIAGAAAAVAADVALRRVPWNNVAGAILLTVLALGLLASGYIRTNGSRLMIAASVFFAVFLAIRTEPLVTTFNVLAACSMLVLAAIHGQGRSFWDLRPLRILADGAAVLFEAANGLVEIPAEVGARYMEAKEQAQAKDASSVYAVLRGLIIAVPLVVVLGLLLASADAVFQSFFSGFNGPNVGDIVGHLILLAIGAYTMMVLIRVAATEGAYDPAQRALTLGHIETFVILAAVNLLFAAFAIAQLMTVLGGAEDALGRAGLDSKEFARQGFFQLLWVAGLTLCMLMVLYAVTVNNTRARGVNRALSLMTVALTLLIVVVAFTRIGFYIEDGGQTPLRLYSAIFCIWVGVAFVAMAVRIWGIKPNTAWLLPVLLVSGLITLGAIDVANPERIIALDNIERNHDDLYWHVVAGQFTGDGQAVLAEEMDRLSPDLAEKVTTELCLGYVGTRSSVGRQGYDYQSGWLDFNLGKWRAENTVPDLCAG